jgi:hypothetical protein
MSDKPNCYHCVYRREVPGSAHSTCIHPATAEEFHDNAAAQAIGILGRHSGITLIPSRAAVELRITASIQGISRGWFIWPVNFDPTWLQTCEGFKATTTTNPQPSEDAHA